MQGWTVYDHPSDYPNSFVARRWVTVRDQVAATNEMFTAETVEELGALLPRGLVCFPRAPSDDPAIVECRL